MAAARRATFQAAGRDRCCDGNSGWNWQMQDWAERWSACGRQASASEIRELLKLLDQPGIISFAGGIPDPALFPVREAQAAYAEVLADGATAGGALQYSVSEGHAGLRGWIVRHMARLGVPCTEDNVVITSGSQQGLEFLGRLLLSPLGALLQ